jgi:hypothetical protein
LSLPGTDAGKLLHVATWTPPLGSNRDVIDHDETRELDQERVREALGEAGERDPGHSGERIDPSRDREARERLEEQPPAGDSDEGEGGEPSGEGDPSGAD